MDQYNKLDFHAKEALLEALRSSLWNRPLIEGIFIGLSRQQWIQVFIHSFRQTIEGHIADSVRKLPKELLPPSDLLLKWIVRLQRIEERNSYIEKIISYQSWLFKENEINAVLQKGHGVSMYYDKPEIRVSGDIDWFFPSREDYTTANLLMQDMGNEFKLTAGFSSHYFFDKIEIEHHLNLIQLRNPFVLSFAKKLIKKLSEKNIFRDFHGELVEIPCPILNIVQVNAHILKHQVTYGVGLRHLCDAARLYHSLSKEINSEELLEIYKELGMLKWIHVFHQVLSEILEVDEKDLVFPLNRSREASWMKDYIMRTGNFGFYDPENLDIQKPGGRVNRKNRLITNFKRFYPLAPLETISFPIVHMFSKIYN